MITNKIFHLAIMASFALSANAADIKEGLTIWFDRPTTLANKAIWWGNKPEKWKGGNKPIYSSKPRCRLGISISSPWQW